MTNSIIKLLVLVLTLALLIGAPMAAAAADGTEEIAQWEEALRYAATPGGVTVIIGFLFSEAAEFLPGFGSWSKRRKRVVFLLACMAVPLLAAGLGCWTAGWPATWAVTFWPAVVAGGLAFGSGTLAHTRKLAP